MAASKDPASGRRRPADTRPGRAVLAWCVAALAAGGCADDPARPADEVPQDSVPVYEYGMKFEPPAGRVVHGLGQWDAYNAKYRAMLPAGAQPASELVFISIGDTPRGWDPAKLAVRLAAIDAAGAIPNVDIALRGNQPSHADFDTLQDKRYGIDDDIANGSLYDARIDDLIDVVRDYGRPVMMRIGGEFNGSWNGYHPWDYPQAFRKIVNRFRQAGVENVAFIWCYMPAAPDDFDEYDGNGQPRWFPGADVIDWFSLDWFDKSDFSGPTTVAGRGDLTAYGRSLKFLDMAEANGRPVIIAESSPARFDLASPVEAGAAWDQWFAPYFQRIADHPSIKWFHYIDYDWTQAAYYVEIGWKNNDLTASAMLAERYVEELSRPAYLHANERQLLKDWERFD